MIIETESLISLQIKRESRGDEFYLYATELERSWAKSLPIYTNEKLFSIFPEAKRIIPVKITEWKEARGSVVKSIREKLIIIREMVDNEFSYWFWREVVKYLDGPKLLEIDRHLACLWTLQSLTTKSGQTKGRLTENQIRQALSAPVAEIVSRHTQLRRSGKNLVGLCPFHKEKYPSFYVYIETNSCWCFGCQQGGDVINLVRLLHGYSFKEAIKYLIEK